MLVGLAPFDKLKAFPDQNASGRELVERLVATPQLSVENRQNAELELRVPRGTARWIAKSWHVRLRYHASIAFVCATTCAAATGFKQDKLSAIDGAVTRAIAEKKLPGGVLWLEHAGISYRKAYGNRSVSPKFEQATQDTIFDAASLTKVVATTTVIMQLVERGAVDLDAPVARYVPAFGQRGKNVVTVRHLMTHVSGLRASLPRDPPWVGYAAAIELACAEELRTAPGSAFVYSDINYIVLGEIARVAGGRPLDELAQRNVFGPLKMTDTGYRPPATKRRRIAPTEIVDGKLLRGIVHDPTARNMGGVAGHAGVFTSASDLARFARMLLRGGELDGVRVLSAASVAEMTRPQIDGSDRRGLGWDVDSRFSAPRGAWFPAGKSFGHTGWTGTSVWIAPQANESSSF